MQPWQPALWVRLLSLVQPRLGRDLRRVQTCNLEWFIQVRERLQDGLVLEARRVAVARIL